MYKDLKKKEKEIFNKTIELKNKYWNIKDYEKARKLQKEEQELYEKQQFYSKLIRKMEEKNE